MPARWQLWLFKVECQVINWIESAIQPADALPRLGAEDRYFSGIKDDLLIEITDLNKDAYKASNVLLNNVYHFWVKKDKDQEQEGERYELLIRTTTEMESSHKNWRCGVLSHMAVAFARS